MKLIKTVAAAILGISCALTSLSAQTDFWTQLDDEVHFAFRVDTTNKPFQELERLFPESAKAYREVLDNLASAITSEAESEGKSWEEMLQGLIPIEGISAANLMKNLRGEIGLAGSILFPAAGSDDPSINTGILFWMTPEEPTEDFAFMVTTALTEAAASEDTDFTMESVNFAGHNAYHISSVSSDYVWGPEGFSTTYKVNETIIVVTDQMLALEIRPGLASFETEDAAKGSTSYSASTFPMLGRSLLGQGNQAFSRLLADNIAFRGAETTSFVEGGVNLAHFAGALDQFIDLQRAEMSAESAEFGVPPVIGSILGANILSLVGFDQSHTLAFRSGVTPVGLSSRLGVGGISLSSPNSVMKHLMLPASGGWSIPDWVPVSAVSVAMESVPLQDIWNQVNSHFTESVGSEWTELIAEADGGIQAMTGGMFNLDGILGTFGDKVYIVSNPMRVVDRTIVDWDFSDGEFTETRRQTIIPEEVNAFVIQVRNHTLAQFAINMIGSQMQMMSAFDEDSEYEELEQLGFKGFLTRSPVSGSWLTLLGSEWLIMGNSEELVNNVVANIANPQTRQARFANLPGLGERLRGLPLDRLSGLWVTDTPRQLRGIKEAFEQAGSSFLGGDSELSFFVAPEMLESFQGIMNALLNTGAIEELGWGISTSELTGDGFLFETIQYPAAASE